MAKNWMWQKPWLPQDVGPKLHPFDGNLMDLNVIFLKALNVDSAHGIVVKARISRHLYAIKFFTTPQEDIDTRDIYGHKGSWSCCDGFDWYFSPFENECRVFGRLEEQRAESIAVKAYEWVSLTGRQIRRKLAAAGAQQLNGFPPRRLYGIVKDWVEMTPYHDPKQRDVYDQMVAVKSLPECSKICTSFMHTKQFVPLLNYYEEVLAMVTKPMNDPLDLLRRNPVYPVRIAEFGAPARGTPPLPAPTRTFTEIGCCAVM